MKPTRLSDQEIEIFKAKSVQLYDHGAFSTSNITRSIAISQFVIIELLERLLEQNKKEQ